MSKLRINRRIRVSYITGDLEWALLETVAGFYVCEVHRCSGEGRRKFRWRVRSLQTVIENYPYPMVLTSDTEV